MVKAAALFYSLAISFLITLISSSLILFAYFSRHEVESSLQLEKARINCQSGMNILLAGKSEIPSCGEGDLDLFGDGQETVHLRRLQWGIFEIGISKGSVGKYSQTLAALLGAKLGSDNNLALVVADHDKPLSLCGKTFIKGLCYLPVAGVKRAYIEGQSFTGDKLIDGEVRTSDSKLPPVNPEIIDGNSRYMNGEYAETDSIIDFEKMDDNDSISNSFLNKTLVMKSTGPIEVINKKYSGNIRLVSGSNIFISSMAELSDVILYAPIVEIEKGFTGTIQVFASDTLIVNEDVKLIYPSAAGVIGLEKNKGGKIWLGKNTLAEGVIFAYSENGGGKNPVWVSVDKDAIIKGILFCSGMVEMKGSVYGTIICDKFILTTPSSVYENNLLNATVDASRLSVHFAGADILESFAVKKERNIVKWL
ncbi:MAG: hypothetical protein HYY40_11835 [Bacteroidetes bacterium]|nr:hypothetical protein [Bacteroidota bacterium]